MDLQALFLIQNEELKAIQDNAESETGRKTKKKTATFDTPETILGFMDSWK